MSAFSVELELSGTFVAANPGLKVLVNGQVVDLTQISAQTGSSTSTVFFNIPFSGSLSSLSFLFEDASGEANRSITISNVKVNNYSVSNSHFVFNDGGVLNGDNAVIEQNESLEINVNALDFVLNQREPTLADLDTVTITGTSGNDEISGGKTAAVIDGGDGHDDIRTSNEDDQIFGGNGSDVVYSREGDDFVVVGEASDRVYAGAGNDFISGGNGNDALNGEDGNDVIFGGAGQDKLYGETGNDILDGGADNDRIYGQEGDDTISGGSGNDAIYTGTGTDYVDGGEGDDVIWAEGGANTLDGGAGNDTIRTDNDSQVDTVNGGEGHDVILGDTANDILNGDGGNDRIEGNAGNDTIDGGDGDDKLFGQDGHDTIYGGAGARDDIYGGAGNDTIYGQEGFDKIFGDDGHDTLHGGGDLDVIRGGAGNDTINGDEGDDRLFGDDGDDIINGGIGNDFIRGLAGADTINAGDGDDTIIHDDNTDAIDGGSGYDILQIAGDNFNNINVTAGDLNAVNIDRIALENSNGVPFANLLTMSIADVVSLSDAGTLYITGDIGFDTVTVGNLDTVNDFVSTVDIDGITYDHYQQGSSNLYVQNGLTLLSGSAPIAYDDTFTGNEDNNISGNVLSDNGNGADFDPGGSTITAVSGTFSTTAGGSVTINSDGSFIYTPVADYEGTDTFTYTVQNTSAESDSGLVTLNVTGVNDGPVAQNDIFAATKNIDLTGDLLADNGNGDDTDTETLVLGAQAETITTSNGATVVINADGTFTYTPPTGFVGPDSFNYTLVDEHGGTDVGSVSVVVQDANALPVGDISLNLGSGSSTSVPDNVNVNTGGPYDAKSTFVRFETGADVTTRQTIYEQGGGTRGINIYIENGELHMAVWNFAEENWGYKEVTTSIGANETHVASFIFDGEFPSNGDITGYLDGVNIGSDTGVGLLYAHGDDIGVGRVDGSTVYGGSSSGSANIFQGEVEAVVQYNEILSDPDREAVEANLGTPSPVFVIEDVQQETVPNDPAINNGGPYSEKTLALAFSTGTDVTSRQVIYEQGGTVRGMSMYIEAGVLHIAAWNYAEENWGYKEVTTAVNAEEFYTATLILNGTQAETGTLEGFLNGISVGTANNVGLLYNHPGNVGVGEIVNHSVFGGVADTSTNTYFFDGTIERIAQYNDALEGNYLLDLHSTMASENPNVTDNTFIGDAGDNVIGGGNGNDNIQGRAGDDSISGNGGNDTIRGEDDNDTLYGNAGDDFLYGGTGSDILVGGTGLDVMYGEAGSDTFGFLQMDGNIDQIRDFTLTGADADVLNITDILDGFDLGVDNINDFVIVNVVNASRTDIRINSDGVGNDSEVLAIVRGSDFTGNTAQDLLDNGRLIVDQSIV